MHGPMRSGVGNIEKKWIVTIVFIDKSGGMIIYRIGVIKLFRFVFLIRIAEKLVCYHESRNWDRKKLPAP